MAKAKKLPSGSWRSLVYSHTDGSGKRKYESFTASTKQEAEMLAAQFKAKNERHSACDLNVGEAIDGYIAAKEGILSPATVRLYRQMRKSYYAPIEHLRIKKLNSEDLQRFVSALAQRVNPKTVSNVYGLITASVGLYAPDKRFRVSLPAKAKKRQEAPSNELVAALYEEASPGLKKCIALSAFGSLRRGEICALTYGDLSGNVLHIHRDMVLGENGKWITKDMPKTADSIRSVTLPQEVVDLLGAGESDERIIKVKPSTITSEFCDLRNRMGIQIRFHDLRHYYASIGATLVPDTYLAAFGGWRQGSSVMKTVYQNQITPIADGYAKKMTDYFSDVIKNAT